MFCPCLIATIHPKASQSNARKNQQAASMKSRGAMIMKTVSILLVNSRRICNQRSKETTTKNGKSGKNHHRPNKMDDSIGKPTPKTLEILKRKTHFSKWVNPFTTVCTLRFFVLVKCHFSLFRCRKELTTLCKIYRKLVLNCFDPQNKAKGFNVTTVISRQNTTAEVNTFVAG